MLRDEVVAWIMNMVQEAYSMAGRTSEIDASIQALKLFLELEENAISEEMAITEMADASDMTKPLRIKNFTDIERFMKILCEIVKPDMMRNAPQALTPENREWMLANMYREAFRVVEPDVHLNTKPEKYTKNKNFTDHYLRVYQFRNGLIHDHDVDLSQTNIHGVTVSTLVVKMDLCRRNRAALQLRRQEVRRRKLFDGQSLVSRIRTCYENQKRDGFGYLDVHWREENSQDGSYSVQELLEREDLTCVKLLGEAGTGKSTALRRMEYVLTDRYREKGMPMPIYIELGALVESDTVVLAKIADIMGVEESLAEEFLQAGELCLLLDGFNEILDQNLKKRVSKELDNFYRSYPGTRIFLTDRAIARASIPTLREARKLYLDPIRMEDRRSYFEKNCKDKACLQRIFRKMEEDPGYFEHMNTPLKLRQLLDVAMARQELPVDITNEFICYLMEREQDEKKDENIEYLPAFLQSLAVMEQEQMSERDAVVQMAKCKRALGYSVPDTMQCLKLAVDMGLLIYEEKELLRFANQEYQEYFFMEGVVNRMDELLQG